MAVLFLKFYFCLCWVFTDTQGLSLAVASGGYSVVVRRLLTALASLVAEHGLQGLQASAVVAHGLSCAMTGGIFPDQGSNPCHLPWQTGSQPLDHQGSSRLRFLNKESGVLGQSRNLISERFSKRNVSVATLGPGSAPSLLATCCPLRFLLSLLPLPVSLHTAERLDPIACLIKTSHDLSHQTKCRGSPRPVNPAWPGPCLAPAPLGSPPHTRASHSSRWGTSDSFHPPSGLCTRCSLGLQCTLLRSPVSLSSVPTPSPTALVS